VVLAKIKTENVRLLYIHVFQKILLYGTQTRPCTKRDKSKLQVMKFLMGKVGKTRIELKHTVGESRRRWWKYRTNLRAVD
jgi:hypothetical protein